MGYYYPSGGIFRIALMGWPTFSWPCPLDFSLRGVLAASFIESRIRHSFVLVEFTMAFTAQAYQITEVLGFLAVMLIR